MSRHGQGHEEMQTETMNGHRLHRRQRLNTQTLMTRRGTGEKRGGRRPDEVTRGRTWREQNYRQRETEGRTKETLKGHSGAWKIKTNTQQDMIQRT